MDNKISNAKMLYAVLLWGKVLGTILMIMIVYFTVTSFDYRPGLLDNKYEKHYSLVLVLLELICYGLFGWLVTKAARNLACNIDNHEDPSFFLQGKKARKKKAKVPRTPLEDEFEIPYKNRK